MTRAVVVSVDIDAPPARVWRALTAAEEVVEWVGVTPLDVAADYPRVGQHARWRASFAGVPTTLHDRIVTVAEPHRFGARIDVGPCRIDEEYRLEALDDGRRTRVVSHNAVRGRLPGLGPLAAWAVRRDVTAAMASLARYCATSTGSPGR